MQNRLEASRDAREEYKSQLAELRANIEAEKMNRPASNERTSALEELASLKKEMAELEREFLNYGACDPVKVEEKRRATMLAKEAAVRWTDNYSMLFSYFTRQSLASPEEIRQYLGVDDEYEDIC